ncbi:SCO family protein [Jatrophihabitans sp.]|uniref:SCO family protein n=1 Tax=Jatrophihabitans sp. TaxID=1932789 RepID=UPI002CDB7CAD|nr:SCO family protein [Jatrophihabitans sp.]
MSRLRGAGAALAAAVLLATLAGCGSGGSDGSPAASASASELNDHAAGSGYSGLGLDPPQPRPQFTLTDTAGKAFRFGADTAGKPTLLFFGYTTCPDVCPTTLADIANALREVPEAVRQATRVVFVTTDVKHDTAPVLKSYLAKFDPGLPNRFIGLWGSQSEVDAAQVAAHVTLAEDEGRTHSSEVLLYGTDDYARVAFLQSTNQAEQVAHDLPLVADTK